MPTFALMIRFWLLIHYSIWNFASQSLLDGTHKYWKEILHTLVSSKARIKIQKYFKTAKKIEMFLTRLIFCPICLVVDQCVSQENHVAEMFEQKLISVYLRGVSYTFTNTYKYLSKFIWTTQSIVLWSLHKNTRVKRKLWFQLISD